jgi:tetratricopeptide (TPR) repeat protein
LSSASLEGRIEEILTQKYLFSPEETVEAINQCDNLIEALTIEDTPDKEFYIRLIQLLRLFLNSEFTYLRQRTEKALNSYQKLQTSINETQTQFPDLSASLSYDINRLTLRIDARIQEIRAKLAFKEKDYVQADILYVETINRYNAELQLEQEKNDYDHYFDSLSNIFLNSGNLNRLRGKHSNDRNELYQALKNYKKAKFLGQPNLDKLLQETHEEIVSFTITKLETQADSLFGKGLIASESEHYREAVKNYQKSAQIFHSLRQITQNIEYELQEHLQFSSYYEATAKNYMIQDNYDEAATQFLLAAQTLQKVLEKMPSDVIKQNFEPQIVYFQAMRLFSQAVTEYDKMLPAAMDHFKEAQEKISGAKLKAVELENNPLVKSCDDALNKLKSYLEIAELMFQPEDDSS